MHKLQKNGIFPLKAFLELCQTSKMERFAEIVNGFKLCHLVPISRSWNEDRIMMIST